MQPVRPNATVPPEDPPGPGCLPIIAYLSLFLIAFGFWTFFYNCLQRPVLVHLYGQQAYHDGLRIVGRQGQLYDGRRIPEPWDSIVAFGSFVASAPFWMGYYLLLIKIGVLPAEGVPQVPKKTPKDEPKP